MYCKLKNFRRNSLIVTAVIFVLFVIAVVVGMDEAGETDGVASQNISTSHLSQYSETITVGEAFNQFSAILRAGTTAGALEKISADTAQTC